MSVKTEIDESNGEAASRRFTPHARPKRQDAIMNMTGELLRYRAIVAALVKTAALMKEL